MKTRFSGTYINILCEGGGLNPMPYTNGTHVAMRKNTKENLEDAIYNKFGDDISSWDEALNKIIELLNNSS